MRLTGKRGMVLVFILSLAAIAGLWFGYTKPQVDNYAKAVAERDENLEKVDYFRSKVNEINSTGVDYLGDLYKDVRLVDRLLPGKIDRADIASIYPSRAQSLGLTVRSFDPGTETDTFMPFQGEFSGSYSSIISWLDYLENADNIITVGSMSVTAGADGGDYTLSMTMNFQKFNSPPLQPRTSNATVEDGNG